MKLCFFVNNYSHTGGLQRVVSILANGLSSKAKVGIISMYNIPEKSPYYYDENININIIHKSPKKHYLLDSFSTINTLKSYIKNNNYDYLIYTSEILSPYAYLSCKNTKTKPICWMHTPAFAYDNPIIQRILRHFSMKKAYYTITLTKKSMDKLISDYKTNRVSYIPNPIDPCLTSKTINYHIKTKKIISVGRICYAKYFEKLIEVAALALPKMPNWTWDIYGDGDIKIKNNLINLIKKNNLENRIFLKGNSKEIYNIYQNYSFLVMTSRYEGFPMTLLEAMSQGLPLVAFDILTGPNEIIENNVNGILIEPFNSLKMANTIIKLSNDENKLKEMSIEGLNLVNKFSIEKISNIWIDILNEI